MLKEQVKILVVDDVNTMRVQIKALLNSFGYKNVSTASNGEEAKTILSQGQFQLVLSDWHMTPMDGLELLRYVRTQSEHREIAFIMITAENTQEGVMEAIQEGVDDYLLKPLTLEKIKTKVTGVLLRKQVLT